MAAVNQTTVPWCTIIVRNSFGVAGAVHQPAGRLSLRYAWPSAYWGSLPLEGGIEAAYRAEIDAAPDPAAKLSEIEDRLNKLRSPFRTAETFWVEEIIDPRKTRPLLCEFARLADKLLLPAPPRSPCVPEKVFAMADMPVLSDLNAIVLKIEVAAGDRVQEGDTLIMLEFDEDGNSGRRAARRHRGRNPGPGKADGRGRPKARGAGRVKVLLMTPRVRQGRNSNPQLLGTKSPIV